MAHTIEPAASGRAKCRGCGEKIAKDELRLGARLPNPFVEGELTLWLHLPCGAFKLPEAFLEALSETTLDVDNSSDLSEAAKQSLAFRRLPRLDRASKAPTGRAKCRRCKESIDKGAWRIGLVFFDDVEGRFQPGGFIHAACAGSYFETADLIERIVRFSPGLEAAERDEIAREIEPAESEPPA